MRVLSLIHSADASSGLFASTVRELGHSLEECSFSLGSPPRRPLDAYDAAVVFGGTMNVAEKDACPWMEREIDELRGLLASEVPVLGVCLGGQLLAAAAGGSVLAMQDPEIGWYEVELTNEARDDALFGTLPDRFLAYEWHAYEFAVPPDAVPLARSHLCHQAFRIGDHVWALQFHPEVTSEIAASWIDSYGGSAGLDCDRARAELSRNIQPWNTHGIALGKRFLAVAGTRAAAGR